MDGANHAFTGSDGRRPSRGGTLPIISYGAPALLPRHPIIQFHEMSRCSSS